MQLRKPEALRMLHNKNARVRHVHTDLNHRRRDEQLDLVRIEALHHRLFFCGLHAPVQQSAGNAVKDAVRKFLVNLLHRRQIALLACLNQRADDIRLPSTLNFFANKGIDFFARCLIA